MLKIFKNKGINRYLAIILIFAFCFSSIGLPIAYASEVAKLTPDAINVRDSSDTINKPKDYGNVIIAPPSDLPAQAGKNRVEIPSRRNVNSKLFLEPNGTFTQEIYPESIFYQNDKKQWVPIESKLVNANDAAFKVKNKANSFNLNLGDNAKMRFEEKDMFIEIEPKGAKPSQGTVNENKIKYERIYPEVDIEYTSKMMRSRKISFF